MNFEEFLTPEQRGETNEQTTETTEATEPVKSIEEEGAIEESVPEVELDVQKAVVESLAADKAEQNELIAQLRREKYDLMSQVSALKEKLSAVSEEMTRMGDLLAKNTEAKLSSNVALLDRNVELEDRFTGETYDHVIEVLKEARANAENEGRHRRAQILEAVLVANEPTGELEKRRKNLEKLFADNQNIVSGTVINELDKLGISHKNGEDYLLPSEIIKRTY